MIRAPKHAWRALIASSVLLCLPSLTQAVDCADTAVCSAAATAAPDLIRLRDGRTLCGTIVHEASGRHIIIVTAGTTQTIAWDDMQCLARTPSAAPQAAKPTLASAALGEDSAWKGFSLAWDVRLVANALLKRYEAQDITAWSWGAGGGVGFGVALHYQTAAALNRRRSISWIDFELGLTGAVTYVAWNQVSGHSATMVEQDTSLALGPRLAFGDTRSVAGVQHWSGVMIGLAWLPTYVDFFGSTIAAKGTLNPAGVRLTIDVGSAVGPDLGHSPLLHIALAWLPYVGRLPTALSLGVGLLVY